MTVLVLTSRLDPTADLVVHELGSRDVPVFRCDTAQFPESLSLSAHLDEGGWRGALRTAEREVELEDVTSVYYRRPTSFQLSKAMAGHERNWAEREARMGFGGVIAALPCRWLNHPHRIAVAEYKPFQLATAIAVGLRVPATLISNEPGKVREFAENIPNGVVYKGFCGGPGREDGRSVALYTSLLDPADHEHPGIARTAHLFQEWIPKSHEVRVTVVGDRLFGVRIDAGSTAAQVDWRSDYDSHTYAVEEIPDKVRAAVLDLLGWLELSFGALDFIVTPDQEWIFLEINPNGQWGWLEHETGLPITAAIADMLVGDRSRAN